MTVPSVRKGQNVQPPQNIHRVITKENQRTKLTSTAKQLNQNL